MTPEIYRDGNLVTELYGSGRGEPRWARFLRMDGGELQVLELSLRNGQYAFGSVGVGGLELESTSGRDIDKAKFDNGSFVPELYEQGLALIPRETFTHRVTKQGFTELTDFLTRVQDGEQANRVEKMQRRPLILLDDFTRQGKAEVKLRVFQSGYNTSRHNNWIHVADAELVYAALFNFGKPSKSVLGTETPVNIPELRIWATPIEKTTRIYPGTVEDLKLFQSLMRPRMSLDVSSLRRLVEE